MSMGAEECAEAILACVAGTLPEAWESAVFVIDYEDAVVTYTGRVLAEGEKRGMILPDEDEDSPSVADIAILLRAAMLDEFGKAPIRAKFSLRRDADTAVSFEYGNPGSSPGASDG